MFVLLSVVWLTLPTLPADSTELASLCVEVVPDAQHAGEWVAVRPLVAALRARIARRHLRVFACSNTGPAPTWHMSVARPEGARTSLRIEGRGGTLAWEMSIDPRLRPLEVARLVALSAAEAVRPSVDSVLMGLGVSVEELPSAEDDVARAFEALEADAGPPEAPVEVKTTPIDSTRGPGIDLTAGALGATQPLEPLGFLEASAAWPIGSIAVTPTISWRALPQRRYQDVRISGTELTGGIGGAYRAEHWDLRLSGLGRTTILRISGADTAPTRVLNAGLSAGSRLWLWRNRGTRIGLALNATLWLREKRFLAYGERLLTLSHGELGVGIVLAADLLARKPHEL